MPIQAQMSLNDYLAQRGLGFISVPPDGDCFYHAVEIVTGIGLMNNYDGTVLRARIANEVSKESVWDGLSPFIVNKTKEEFVASILTNGEWFDGELIQTIVPQVIGGYLTVYYYDFGNDMWTFRRFGEKEYDKNYQVVWHQHIVDEKTQGAHYDAVVSTRMLAYYMEKKIETALSKVVLPLTNNMSTKITFDPAPEPARTSIRLPLAEPVASPPPKDDAPKKPMNKPFKIAWGELNPIQASPAPDSQREKQNHAIDSAIEKVKLQHQMELERAKHDFAIEKMQLQHQLELEQARRGVEMIEKVSAGAFSFIEEKAKREREMSEYLESVRNQELDRIYNVTFALTNQLGMISSRQHPQTMQSRPALPGTTPEQLPAPQKTQEKAHMIEIPKEANRRQISVINSLIDSGKKAQAETMIERIRNGENV